MGGKNRWEREKEKEFLTNSIGECPSHGLLLKKPEGEDERVQGPSREGGGRPSRRKKGRDGFEAIFGSGHARKIYRRTGKLLPDVRSPPRDISRKYVTIRVISVSTRNEFGGDRTRPVASN